MNCYVRGNYVSQTQTQTHERTGETDRGRATSVDVDAETAAALSYPFSIPAVLVLLIEEEENEFVRFHVIQSALYTLVAGGAWSVALLIGLVFSAVTFGFGMFIVGPVLMLMMVPILGYLGYAAYLAYGGERYRMPFIADYAEEYV